MTAGAPIRRVVIVGGGTAGWMTAAALSRFSAAHKLAVTLVESDEIGTVGVGEATIVSLHDFHEMLGIAEADFMRATGATFKLGILFSDWGRIGETYFHPFGSYGVDAQGVRFHQLWLRLAGEPETGRLDAYNMTASAALAGAFDKPARRPDGIGPVSYAYHLDAGRYARFLRAYAEARGVERIEGRIERADLDRETGHVAAVALAGDRRIEGDLLIDCSGFRALLAEEALGVGYQDWSRWLPCDRALAMPTAIVEPARPYTRAMADTAGWRWRIPLQHRVGNGYVYCGDCLSDEAARDRLIETIAGEALAEPRLIRFIAGRRERLWERNCVAIGLAGGFVEPLESTSIHLIQFGIARLLALFPDRSFAAAERDAYNEALIAQYEQVRDFVVLHYKLTTRADTPFWDRVREMPVPDSLAEKMALFAGRARLVAGKPHLFTDDSWIAVLFGQGMRPAGHDPLADLLPFDETRRYLGYIRAQVAKSVAAMPTHARFIAEHVRAAAET